MQDVDQERCTWLVQYNNLLGYIQQTLGSNTEALMSLHKAESLMQEHETEEAGVRLQVNKANLAWVYFLMGEMDKSKEYLEEVERLQRMHPAPPECALHPEVSGEKGWTLLKFNKSKKEQAIKCFEMALKAEPERKEWHKGLATARSKYVNNKCPSELKTEILKQVKIAHENEPNNLFLHALYLLKQSEVQPEDTEREMQGLLVRTLHSGDLEGFSKILQYFGNISKDTAIIKASRVREKFPESSLALKHLANCYKWKVHAVKEDHQERELFARSSIALFERVVRDYPDSIREKVALASMHYYADNTKRADEIYQQLLSEKDLSPYRQQYIYYNYAWHLYTLGQANKAIHFHMKVAEIQNDSYEKEKSRWILKTTVKKGRDPRCEEIQHFLERINISVTDK
ncbi:interferon-induced protein with tetratricopeptide repeats 2-like [Garra rufa]|uniref:interferon-induced protein with tetratricopeptide repeats 2-like n=1 Tax=Garra rufa TaxID=137080 RepID=UPI003CCEEECC